MPTDPNMNRGGGSGNWEASGNSGNPMSKMIAPTLQTISEASFDYQERETMQNKKVLFNKDK